ncbi:MAG: hypothetical protein COU27_01560, partial [Candidatus Levybacteria bacterium CG10_big_fil_rev_8_21_14_0_10_36_7]
PNQPAYPVPPPTQPSIQPDHSSSRNWLKIAGIVLGIIVIISGSGYLLGVKNANVSQAPEQATQAPKPEADRPLDETASWKTYTNSKYGYQIEYPSEWSIIGSGPNITDPCVSDAADQQVVTVMQDDINCENEKGFDKLKVSLTITVGNTEWKEDEIIPFASETINIGDIQGWTTRSDCTLQTGCMQIIYFNHNGNGFGIMSEPVDGVGDYDYSTLFDQILSTFKFTN